MYIYIYIYIIPTYNYIPFFYTYVLIHSYLEKKTNLKKLSNPSNCLVDYIINKSKLLIF